MTTNDAIERLRRLRDAEDYVPVRRCYLNKDYLLTQNVQYSQAAGEIVGSIGLDYLALTMAIEYLEGLEECERQAP